MFVKNQIVSSSLSVQYVNYPENYVIPTVSRKLIASGISCKGKQCWNGFELMIIAL